MINCIAEGLHIGAPTEGALQSAGISLLHVSPGHTHSLHTSYCYINIVM